MGRGRGNRNILLGKNNFPAAPKNREFVFFEYKYQSGQELIEGIQIFSGKTTKKDLYDINAKLEFGFFVPAYVGLPSFSDPNEDPWHQLDIDGGITDYTAERFEKIEAVGN